jgi:hypothetical protein
MIRPISVPSLALTWDDLVESFVDALFAHTAAVGFPTRARRFLRHVHLTTP